MKDYLARSSQRTQRNGVLVRALIFSETIIRKCLTKVAVGDTSPEWFLEFAESGIQQDEDRITAPAPFAQMPIPKEEFA